MASNVPQILLCAQSTWASKFQKRSVWLLSLEGDFHTGLSHCQKFYPEVLMQVCLFWVKLFLFQTLPLTNSSFSWQLRLFKQYYVCLSQVCTVVCKSLLRAQLHCDTPWCKYPWGKDENEPSPKPGFVLWLLSRERQGPSFLACFVLCLSSSIQRGPGLQAGFVSFTFRKEKKQWK